MRASSGRRRLSAVVCATAVLAAQAVALAALPAASAAAVPAQGADTRTVPGTPGVPQAPTVVYGEGFENNTGATPVLLPAYVGAPPQNETYTADPVWLNPARCNGIILTEAGANQADCQAQSPVAMTALKALAGVLGQVNGSPTPTTNHVVSAYTDGDSPGADKVEFQTVNPIPLPTTGRFITFSVDAAALNCAASAPLLEFYLTGGGADIPTFTSPINPCTDPRSQNFYNGLVKAGSYPSNGSVLFNGASLGLKMINAQGSGDGNDHAFDNVRILDVTPQLDKSFAPSTIKTGEVSTLTLTVTNTTDLAAKTGFGLTDALPAGLKLAATPNATTTCGPGTVTATGGAASFALTGGALNAGQASCTVKVDVTAAAAGSYVNGPAQTTLVGLNPPADATLIVNADGVDLSVKKTGPATVKPGGKITYKIVITNNGPNDSTGWTLTDTIPAGVTGAATSTPGCGIGAGTLTCAGGPLAKGESVTVNVTGKAGSGPATVKNTAKVTGKEPDPVPGNNTSTTTTKVSGTPGLTITKKQNGPATVKAGATVKYTITVKNTGTTNYTASAPASFTDDLSDLLDDARYKNDAKANRGTVKYSEPVLKWSGALTPGQSATITFSITTNARPFGDLKLLNTVVSKTPGNNCRPATTRAAADPRCSTKGKIKAKDKDKRHITSN